MRWRWWRRRRIRRDVVWPASPTEVLWEQLPTEPIRMPWMDAPTEDFLAWRVPPYAQSAEHCGRHRRRF